MLDVKIDLVGDFGTFGCFRSLSHEKESGGQNDHKRDDNSLDVSHVEEHGYKMGVGGGGYKERGPVIVEQAAEDTYLTRGQYNVERPGTLLKRRPVLGVQPLLAREILSSQRISVVHCPSRSEHSALRGQRGGKESW